MQLDPPPFATFGERLTWWRKARGFKRQGALADLIGLKQASLSNLETGESAVPAAATLLSLAAALNLRPQYLLTGDGPAEGANFQELTGLEAQLVMIFRQLPSDGLRQALLIDANDMLRRSVAPAPPPAPVVAPAPAPAAEYQRLKIGPRVRQKTDHRKTG